MDSRSLFEVLVRENADMVRAYLLASVREPGTAEDLLQRTFAMAWHNFARHDRQLPFGPWVRGIAAKLLLRQRRSAGRARLYACDAESLGVIERRFEAFESLPGDTLDEKLDVMRDCLGALSPHQRQAVALHYEHGLHCREIAQRLNLEPALVRTNLQRGRAAILHCMQRKMDRALLEERRGERGA